MNGKRTLGMVCAVAGSFMNLNADAASGMEGLEACASALARELANDQGSAVEVRISDESVAGRRLHDRTTYFLDARDPRSQEIVAKADCSVDKRARVQSLVRLPNDAPEASVRSL